MTDKAKYPESELFDQAWKSYDQALRTGLKIQEDAGKCFTKMLNQAASPEELHKQVASMANDFIPATQKSLDDYLALLEQNSRASVDLMKKGVDAAQTTNLADTQGKLVEFCEASLRSLKANAQAVVDVNTKAIDSWMVFVKKAAAAVDLKAEKA